MMQRFCKVKQHEKSNDVSMKASFSFKYFGSTQKKEVGF